MNFLLRTNFYTSSLLAVSPLLNYCQIFFSNYKIFPISYKYFCFTLGWVPHPEKKILKIFHTFCRRESQTQRGIFYFLTGSLPNQTSMRNMTRLNQHRPSTICRKARLTNYPHVTAVSILFFLCCNGYSAPLFLMSFLH